MFVMEKVTAKIQLKMDLWIYGYIVTVDISSIKLKVEIAVLCIFYYLPFPLSI